MEAHKRDITRYSTYIFISFLKIKTGIRLNMHNRRHSHRIEAFHLQAYAHADVFAVGLLRLRRQHKPSRRSLGRPYSCGVETGGHGSGRSKRKGPLCIEKRASGRGENSGSQSCDGTISHMRFRSEYRAISRSSIFRLINPHDMALPCEGVTSWGASVSVLRYSSIVLSVIL